MNGKIWLLLLLLPTALLYGQNGLSIDDIEAMKDFGYEDTQIGFELNRTTFQRLRRRFSPRFLKDVAN